MRIAVRIKPGAREDAVERISDARFLVRVKAPAKENKANAALVKLIAEYLDIPRSSIIIIKGQTSREKVLEVGER